MSAAGWRLWVLQLQCCSHCGCFLLRAASAATACSGDFGCSTASRPDQPCAPSSEPPSPTRSGRKRAALTYCLAYTLGCFTKHFNSFWILAGGRVLCGFATSLLFSAFESWLVAEHFKVGGWLCGWRGGGGAVSGW